MQKMREIGQKEAAKLRALSNLMDGNSREKLPDGKEGMQRLKSIKDVMKIHAGMRKVLHHDPLSRPMAVDEKR